jgi:predicted ATPase
MLALYRSGRQADALETFQEARRVLADELGLEPGPDLRRLQEAILAHDPAIAAVPVVRTRRGNLPAASTSFVGREEELGNVAALLHEHRLVTLTGPPGVGKSRLAVETARSLEHEFPDGIWLVDFARAAAAADAVRLLANVVDARGADPLARAASRLRNAEALLVLDACEHVSDEAARLASTLLAECRRLRILATSRETLHVAGEVRFPLAPLGVAAVDLFLDRARAARPGFEADAEAVALAGEIALRVEGLPLAIELAAARVNVLGLAELVSILERRAALLRDSPVSDPSRTALRALVEWSYDLLHADEKTLLQHLAVHRGGGSLESLVAVAATDGLNEPTFAYLVSALVDKSIVSVSFSGGAARYDMLDTVREYVLERLDESGGLAAAQKAHADYFATLADAAHAGLRRPEWPDWMKQLELEHNNLWAAVTFVRDASDPLLAARLGVGLGWYFGTAERVSEGRTFIEAALGAAQDAPLALRIELLAYLCYLATEEDDLDAAIDAGERGVALAATSDAPWQTAMVQLALAFAYDRAGPHERAVVLAEEARRAFDELGDRWGAASSALAGALGALGRGDIATAAALTAEAVRLHDDYDIGAVPAALLEASVAERRGETEAAAAAYRRALERSERAGFADHAAFALSGIGSNALVRGDLREAEELQRQALATAEAAHATWAAAHARVQLARVAVAAGDAATAEQLYRQVLEWSRMERPHQAREGLFLALAGSPATAAELELAELAATALT